MMNPKPELPAEAVAALARGSKIEAIKAVREASHVGLKEAKQIVEDYVDRHPAMKSRMAAANAQSAQGVLKWLAVIAVAILLIALLASRAATGADRDTGRRQFLEHDGLRRSYVVVAPAAAASRKAKLPLVLVLHGGGGNAANAERMTGFSAKARDEGFLVAYPEGTGRFQDKLLTWNAGHCCGLAMTRHVDDVGFIEALIDRLAKDYPVDPRRIYATGMSNGGMMTHRLGRELPHRLAAIAPVVATLFGDEMRPPQAVSALMINGGLDKSVPPQGGPPGGRFPGAWDGTPAKPVLAQGAYWAGVNGCEGDPARSEQGTLIQWRYRCPAGRGVEIFLVGDTGHAWPGGLAGSNRGDAPGTTLDATTVIWDFFKAHPK